MKARLIFSGVIGLALILGSCGSSNSVVSNGLIQKRKYNKGFFMKSNGQFKTAKAEGKEEKSIVVQEEIAVNNTVRTAEPVSAVAAVQHSEKVTFDMVAEASVSTPVRSASHAATPVKVNATKEIESRKEVRKDVREQVKQLRKKESSSSAVDGMTILLVILAIIIPPLAVGIYEGITVRFWIDLILALIGWGLAYWLLGAGIAFLGGLAAIIYALLIVLEVI